jgi:outer membrane protein, heavy metal efflux system
VLELAKADLEYYDKIIEISRDRFKRRRHRADRPGPHRAVARAIRVGDSDGDRQPAHGQDSAAATAGRPHAGGAVRRDRAVRLLRRAEAARRLPPGGAGRASRSARALESIQQAQTNHKLAIANGSTDPTFGAWYTWNSSNNNPERIADAGLSVSIPLRIFDRNQGEKQRTQIDIDRNQQLTEPRGRRSSATWTRPTSRCAATSRC